MRLAPLINLLVVTFILLSNHSSMSLPSTKIFPHNESDRQRSKTGQTHSPEDEEPQNELDSQVVVDSEKVVEEEDHSQDLGLVSSESTQPPPTKRKRHKHHHHHHRRRPSHERESDEDGDDDEDYHIIKKVSKRKVPPHKLKSAKLRSIVGSSEEEAFAPPPPHKSKSASHPKSHPTESTESEPPQQTPPSRRSVITTHKPTPHTSPAKTTGSMVTVPKMNPHKYDNLLVDLPDYEDSDEDFKIETTTGKGGRPIGLKVDIPKNSNIQKDLPNSFIIDIKEEHSTRKPIGLKVELPKESEDFPNPLIFDLKEDEHSTGRPIGLKVELPKEEEAFPNSLILDLKEEHSTAKPAPHKTSPTTRRITTTRHPTTKPHPTQHPTPKPRPTHPTTTAKPKPKPTSPTTTKKPSNSSVGDGRKCIKLVEEAGYRPEARTKHTIYRGKIMDLENSKTVFLFYGISYAAPPIDNLRFKPPFPPDLQSQMRDGYIDATRMNPPCFPSRIGRTSTSGADNKNDTGKGHGNSERGGDSVTIASEDCLYLNIWLPDKVVLDDQPGSVILYPVIVWIHGEGFLSGMNTEDYKTIAEFVAATDFIVVTIQYRSGVFGFLHLTSTESIGNQGLQDQVQALKWVEENIECFGGDPHSVTLMGHDIGAAFVGYHLLSKISPGYFSRAVMLGGSPLQPHMFQTTQTADKKAMDLATQVGCVTSTKARKAIMECLLSMDPVSIWEVQIMLLQQGHNVLTFPFVPTADGLILTDCPEKLLETGHGKTCEVLIGGSENEGSLVLINSVDGILPHDPTFLSYDKFIAIMRHILGNFEEVEMDAVLHQYKNWPNLMDGFANQIRVADAMGDYYFTCPLRRFSDLWSSRGLPTFQFSFSQQSSGKNRAPWMGAVHGDELDFLFGVPIRFPDRFCSDEVELSRKMMKMLEEFIKSGCPNEEWERYGREVPHYADIAAGDQPFYGNANVPKYGPRLEQCAFWNDLFPKIQGLSGPGMIGNGMGYTPVANRYNFIPPPPDSNGTFMNSPHTFNVDDNCYVALHNCSRSNFAVYVNK